LNHFTIPIATSVFPSIDQIARGARAEQLYHLSVWNEKRGAEALSTLIHYNAYRIEAFERETDRWRAAISRLDGRPIKIAVPAAKHMVVTTSADSLTAKAAIDLAKQGIDGGGMT
jgi:hypothetical protein